MPVTFKSSGLHFPFTHMLNILPGRVFKLNIKLGLLIIRLVFSFLNHQKMKEMKNRYFLLFTIKALLIVTTIISGCSKNEEDIAAPSVTIIQPGANDTVQITNGYITIKVVANDHVDIKDMEMSIEDVTGKVLYNYDADDIEGQTYTCNEKFYPEHIDKVSKLKLNVTFENDYKNWATKSIEFFVKP
jgi:hypothetical protein